MNAGVALVVGIGLVVVGLCTMGKINSGLDNLPRSVLLVFCGIVLFVVGLVLAFIGN